MIKNGIYLLFFGLSSLTLNAQSLAQLKYGGGGDYYANPSALTNLIAFCNQELGTQLNEDYDYLEAHSEEIFTRPFIHLTGHGNVIFTEAERKQLRSYCLNGGFLHIDDNYGMDAYIRLEIAKIFPDKNLELVPLSHQIYQKPFAFKQLPKIHEHDGKASEGWGVFHQGELVLFYSYESDLSDGWEDQEIHQDPEDLRLKALQMGANLIHYAFTRPREKSTP